MNNIWVASDSGHITFRIRAMWLISYLLLVILNLRNMVETEQERRARTLIALL